MVGGTTSALCAAVTGLALMLVASQFRDDGRADFGVIDPQYRSPYSDTAWFVRQPGDTTSPLDDPDLGDGTDEPPIAEPDDEPPQVAFARPQGAVDADR